MNIRSNTPTRLSEDLECAVAIATNDYLPITLPSSRSMSSVSTVTTTTATKSVPGQHNMYLTNRKLSYRCSTDLYNNVYQIDDGGQNKTYAPRAKTRLFQKHMQQYRSGTFQWIKDRLSTANSPVDYICLISIFILISVLICTYSYDDVPYRRRNLCHMIRYCSSLLSNNNRNQSGVVHVYRGSFQILGKNDETTPNKHRVLTTDASMPLYIYSIISSSPSASSWPMPWEDIIELDPSGEDEEREEYNPAYSRKWFMPYYAFDDDEVRAEDLESSTCRRTDFHKDHYPTCNVVHEMDLSHDREDRQQSELVGSGFYRSAFRYQDMVNDNGDDVILKTIRLDTQRFDHWNFEFQRNDALVMNLLQKSPRIVSLYSHCAGTVVTEAAVQDLSDVVVPFGGYEPEEGLFDEHDVDPLNNLTASEKLDVALEMAEAIADMHGHSGGVLVHDDIQIPQFMRGKDGILKLVDFNRAEVMLYDPESEEYCKYLNGPVFGNYRSPEEVNVEPLDEKIDVFSYGNNLHSVLTGLWVYYYETDDQVMQGYIEKGELPWIDPRYRTRSFGEAFLVRLMEICWFYYPNERPSIFDVIALLKDANKRNNWLDHEQLWESEQWMPYLDEIISVQRT